MLCMSIFAQTDYFEFRRFLRIRVRKELKHKEIWDKEEGHKASKLPEVQGAQSTATFLWA